MNIPFSDPGLAGRPDLYAKYEVRKTEVLRALDQIQAVDCHDEAKIAALAGGLHKLAGVAGLFGAARLGALAADGEKLLRSAPVQQRPGVIASLKVAMMVECRA